MNILRRIVNPSPQLISPPPCGRGLGGLAARRRKRGFTLVEIAVVLVAFLVAVGGMLIPFGQRLSKDQYEAAETTIRLIKTAVVDYAARARTRGRWLLDGDGILRRIPPGRPYLPCPDINGDGVEDRLSNRELGADPADTANLLTPASFTSQDEDAAAGNCAFYKGLVPWVTLGTPPADPWGNRFIYRVDPAFAQGALGFDESTIADAFDSRAPLTLTVTAVGVTLTVYQRREDVRSGGITVDIDGDRFRKDTGAAEMELLPNVVCYGTPAGGDNASGCVDDYEPLAGRRITADEAPAPDNLRPYKTDDIADAPPVVIVSTGKNGYYGAIHHSSDGGGVRCATHLTAANAGALGEYQNAVWGELDGHNDCPPADLPFDPSGVSDAPEAAIAFSRQPRSQFNDDVVEWMSADEIKAELGRRGVFPVPGLPRY
jgi:prepilin-type N-terminal cleavage/methylation domain-containing protein